MYATRSFLIFQILQLVLHVTAIPVDSPTIVLRDGSGPIYGSSGKPVISDIHQTSNPDCGFASSLAAVVQVSSDWITSKLTVTGPIAEATAGEVTMYDLDTLSPKRFTIQFSETTTNSDIDTKTDVWWPGLYDHAAIDLGMPNTDGRLGPILPSDALQAITGLKAQGEAMGTEIKDDDALFTLLGNAQSKKSPMVLQTPSGAKTLVGNHAYAVLSTSGTGAGRQVTLYNPWGSDVTYSLENIAADTLYVWHLTNYDTWTGGSTGGGGDNSNTPSTKIRPTSSSNIVEIEITASKSSQTVAVTRSCGDGGWSGQGNGPTSTSINGQVAVVTSDGLHSSVDPNVVIVTKVVVVTVTA